MSSFLNAASEQVILFERPLDQPHRTALLLSQDTEAPVALLVALPTCAKATPPVCGSLATAEHRWLGLSVKVVKKCPVANIFTGSGPEQPRRSLWVVRASHGCY